MHGSDDQIVPYKDSAPLSAEFLPNGTHEGFPHGMPTTEAATIKGDVLAWLQSAQGTPQPAGAAPAAA
jgi:non-heme chloroperoxidase